MRRQTNRFPTPQLHQGTKNNKVFHVYWRLFYIGANTTTTAATICKHKASSSPHVANSRQQLVHYHSSVHPLDNSRCTAKWMTDSTTISYTVNKRRMYTKVLITSFKRELLVSRLYKIYHHPFSYIFHTILYKIYCLVERVFPQLCTAGCAGSEIVEHVKLPLHSQNLYRKWRRFYLLYRMLTVNEFHYAIVTHK